MTTTAGAAPGDEPDHDPVGLASLAFRADNGVKPLTIALNR